MRVNSAISSDDIAHRCIVIADDLTGACDSGLEYARAGLRTRITFDVADMSEADVLVISTDSRRMNSEDAYRHVRDLISPLPLESAKIVFKKIDSALRGNIVSESEAVRHAAKAHGVVLAPALPAQGRVVEDGMLTIKDIAGSRSINVGQQLREQGMQVEKISLEALSRCLSEATSSSPYFLCDATSDEELAAIATALWRATRRTLWIGSAGLAKPLATLLAKDRSMSGSVLGVKSASISPKPVLVCIGSNHPVTVRQIEFLKQYSHCVFFEAEHVGASEIEKAFAQNKHVILQIDMRDPDVYLLVRLFKSLPVDSMAAVFIAGGDTAALICSITEAHELRLYGQIQQGVAIGRIEGGTMDGLLVATKSGGFGAEDGLAQAIEILSTRGKRKQFI